MVRTRQLLVLSVVLMLSSLVFAAYPDDCIDPSFETALDARTNYFANSDLEQSDPGNPNMPLGFVSGPSSPANYEWLNDPSTCFSGNRCLRMWTDQDGVYTMTLTSNRAIDPAKKYVVGMHFKSKVLNQDNYVRLRIPEQSSPCRVGRVHDFNPIGYMSKEKEWRRYIMNFEPCRDLSELRLEIIIGGNNGNPGESRGSTYKEIIVDNIIIYEMADFGDLHAQLPEDANGNRASLESFGFSLLDWDASVEDTAILRWGFPFGVGKVMSPGNIRIRNSQGIVVPSQKRVLSSWWDNSLKWVLIDFEATRGITDYTVEYGTSVTDITPGMLASDNGNTITISTGAMTAQIDKSSFNLFNRVTIDTNSDNVPDAEILGPGGSQDIAAGAGYLSSLDPDVEVTIEENGPLRAVVLAKGHHTNGAGDNYFTHNTRIHFYKDKPFAEVHYTVVNDNDWASLECTSTLSCFDVMQDISLRLPFDPTGATYTFGLDNVGQEYSGTYAGQEAYLLQPEPDPDEKGSPGYIDWQFSYDVNVGGNVVRQGEKSRGWMDVSNSQYGIATATRYFWENVPKELGYDGTSVKNYIMPAHIDHFWIKHGGATTQEMLIYFHPGALSGKVRDNINIFLKTPLIIIPPEQYSESNVFRTKFRGYDPSQFPAYEKEMTDFMYEDGKYHYNGDYDGDELVTFNMINFGDWPDAVRSDIPGFEDNYLNMETDLQLANWMQFARTGWRDLYYKAVASSMHYVDTDIRHVAIPGRETHQYYNIGGAYENEGCMHYGLDPDQAARMIALGKAVCDKDESGTMSHLFAVGSVYGYYMSGDNRILDVLKEIGDHYKATGGNDFLDRIGTRSTENMIMIYDVYQDQELWDWLQHKMDLFKDYRYAFSTYAWPTLECMRTYHWQTGLPRAEDLFLETAEITLLGQWRPIDGSCYMQEVQDHYDHRMFGLVSDMAYAYELTGDPKYIYLGRDNLYNHVATIKDPTALIHGPSILYYMDQQGIPELYKYYPTTQLDRWYDEDMYITETTDSDKRANIFQTVRFRVENIPIMDAQLTVYDPHGGVVLTDHLTKRGLNIYSYIIPEDGLTGQYHFHIELAQHIIDDSIMGSGYVDSFHLGWGPAVEQCSDRDGDNYDGYDEGLCVSGTDCNDNNININPGHAEVCGNGLDDDCDGTVDEGCVSCTDGDGDGYNLTGCGPADCNDNNINIYPGHAEVCGNSVDDDCDGSVDEGCATCVDNDGDGYGVGCSAGSDCDDNNIYVYPGASEVCGNSVDDDCDGSVDEGCDVCDADHDGHDSLGCGGDDCNDAASVVYPGAPELCGNNRDDDCDGEVDETCVTSSCGDGACGSGESCTNCPGDCGSCGDDDDDGPLVPPIDHNPPVITYLDPTDASGTYSRNYTTIRVSINEPVIDVYLEWNADRQFVPKEEITGEGTTKEGVGVFVFRVCAHDRKENLGCANLRRIVLEGGSVGLDIDMNGTKVVIDDIDMEGDSGKSSFAVDDEGKATRVGALTSAQVVFYVLLGLAVIVVIVAVVFKLGASFGEHKAEEKGSTKADPNDIQNILKRNK